MRTIEEIIQEINKANLPSVWDVEDMSSEPLSEIVRINSGEHRWFTVATVVYQLGDKFLGVRGPVCLKSESMSWSDCRVTCEAFEMVAVPSISYKRV